MPVAEVDLAVVIVFLAVGETRDAPLVDLADVGEVTLALIFVVGEVPTGDAVAVDLAELCFGV